MPSLYAPLADAYQFIPLIMFTINLKERRPQHHMKLLRGNPVGVYEGEGLQLVQVTS